MLAKPPAVAADEERHQVARRRMFEKVGRGQLDMQLRLQVVGELSESNGIEPELLPVGGEINLVRVDFEDHSKGSRKQGPEAVIQVNRRDNTITRLGVAFRRQLAITPVAGAETVPFKNRSNFSRSPLMTTTCGRSSPTHASKAVQPRSDCMGCHPLARSSPARVSSSIFIPPSDQYGQLIETVRPRLWPNVRQRPRNSAKASKKRLAAA